MSILNRPSDGLLSVLLALHRGVLAYGPKAEGALIDLVAPSSVVPDGKPDMARKTLTRWKQLGFFLSDAEGVIALSPAIATIAPNAPDRLRAAVLRLVLAPENNPAFSLPGDDDQEGSRASDATRALAWVLAQDPYTFPSRYREVEQLRSGQGVEPTPFVNDTRWGGFSEWAAFLGAAFTGAKVGLVPNPSFAVRTALDDVFGNVDELAQADFFTRLAEALPVVDGGRYRAVVDAQTSRPWRTHRSNEVTPSLSAALLTLEASMVLRLEMRSDAPTRLLLGRAGRELRSISHVVRLGVA
ncbi:MAG: protein DpdG [Bryobacteraceae bacterium]